MADDILKTIEIKKSFHVGGSDIEVLKGINVDIKKKEFVIIFGPSGCGKSTLLHTLLGLEIPTSGKVMLDGQDFYSISEDERAYYRRHHIGIIYQMPLWVSSFSVIENVTFPLYLLHKDSEEAKQKAMNLLQKVGLGQWADYKPTELSSGQQQKISLVRSLMIDPILIVADEPTGNLDTVSGQELLKTFLDLVEEGKSIVMVTHDLEYLPYATKIFHMIDGQVVEEYEPKNSKDKLRTLRGKKDIGEAGSGIETNVRDPKLLAKLRL